MCGRFTLHASAADLASTFGLNLAGFRIEARYNISPGQWIFVLRPEKHQGHSLTLARWGLVPTWAKDPGLGPKPINARAEGLEDKPTFRGAFRHGRCLIPASGFYEWQGSGKFKQPFYIHPAQGGLFAFAGLWSEWAGPDGELSTCAIITTGANDFMATIHDRMPVILPQEAWPAWLDPTTSSKAAADLLVACPSERLAAHPVALAVGRVGMDSPDLVLPMDPGALRF